MHLFLIIGLVTALDLAHIYFFRESYEVNIKKITNSSAPISYNFKYVIAAYLCIATIIYMLYLMSKATKFSHKNILIAAVLGVCVFGIYNFTNAATLKNYSNRIAIHDTLWGGLLLGFAGAMFEYTK